MPTYEALLRFRREAPDGRATFHYGDEVKAGEPHIVWRRIGDHSILNEP